METLQIISDAIWVVLVASTVLLIPLLYGLFFNLLARLIGFVYVFLGGDKSKSKSALDFVLSTQSLVIYYLFSFSVFSFIFLLETHSFFNLFTASSNGTSASFLENLFGFVGVFFGIFVFQWIISVVSHKPASAQTVALASPGQEESSQN